MREKKEQVAETRPQNQLSRLEREISTRVGRPRVRRAGRPTTWGCARVDNDDDSMGGMGRGSFLGLSTFFCLPNFVKLPHFFLTESDRLCNLMTPVTAK